MLMPERLSPDRINISLLEWKPKLAIPVLCYHSLKEWLFRANLLKIKYLSWRLIERSQYPFGSKQWASRWKSLKTDLKHFIFCNLFISPNSHTLCAEDNLGLCYDLEEFQSISHSLCVKISIWLLLFWDSGFCICNTGFLKSLLLNKYLAI